MSEDDKRPDLTESIKLAFETNKQLTTLNAGSIVVIGTFLSNIFPTDSQGTLTVPLYTKLLIGAAFVGFGASLIFATLAMFYIRAYLQECLRTGGHSRPVFVRPLGIILVLSFVPFSGGLICFGAAVLLNLFFGS